MVTLSYRPVLLSLLCACSAAPAATRGSRDSAPAPLALALERGHLAPTPHAPAASAVTLRALPAHSADDFVNSIGVNTHLSYFRTAYGTGWASVVKPKLVELGVRHLRDAGAVLPNDGWMKTVYGRFNELAQSGIHVTLYARLPNQDEGGTVAGFSRLLQYALPAVEAFEGLNEHDLTRRPGWIDEVRTTQQGLYQAVKADPRSAKMPVLGPSFGRAGNAPAVGDVSQWMDFGNIHPYPGGLLPLSNIKDHERKVSGIMGTHPMIVTETGYHTALDWKGEHPGVNEQAMGHYMPRLFLDYYAAGITRTYLYEFLDEGTDQAQREQNFGLVRADGTEKLAYLSLKNMIGLLADPGPAFPAGQLSYSVVGDTTGVNVMAFQKRDGRFYLAVWQEVQSFDQSAKLTALITDRKLRLQLAKPSPLKIYMPVNSDRPIKTLTSDVFELEVPDSPVFVEISP